MNELGKNIDCPQIGKILFQTGYPKKYILRILKVLKYSPNIKSFEASLSVLMALACQLK